MMLRLLLMLCLSLVTATGYATDVYVFGDSLSDTTRTPISGTTPWVYHISYPYQMVSNYATAGAGTGHSFASLYYSIDPDNGTHKVFTNHNLIEQISDHTGYGETDIINQSIPTNVATSCAGDKIHIIWIGTNDSIVYNNLGNTLGYKPIQLGPLPYSITMAYQYITSAIHALKTCGATRIYLVGLYDFSYSRLGRRCAPAPDTCSPSLNPIPNSGLQSYITAVNDQIRTIAAQNSVTYIDTFYDNELSSNYKLNINSTTADSAIFDGIHLSADKQRIIYRRICHVVTGVDCF